MQKIATANDFAAIIGGPLTTECGITIVIPSPDDQFEGAVAKLRDLMRKEGRVHIKDILDKKMPEAEMKLRREVFSGLEFTILELESAWARQRHMRDAIVALAEMKAAEAKKAAAANGKDASGKSLVPVNGSGNGKGNGQWFSKPVKQPGTAVVVANGNTQGGSVRGLRRLALWILGRTTKAEPTKLKPV